MFTNMWNSLHELPENILHRKCRASGSGGGGRPPTRDASQEEGPGRGGGPPPETHHKRRVPAGGATPHQRPITRGGSRPAGLASPTLGGPDQGLSENDGTEPPGKREKPVHEPDGGKH